MPMRWIVRGSVASLCLLFGAHAVAQDQAPVEQAEAVETPAAVEAQGKELQAVFMDVEGPVSWRAGEDQPWQPAKVDDLLSPGAEIRTMFRGRAAIRVGKNATILMDPITTIALPDVIEEGETLRTRVALKQGRADFKVDKVGLDNDFQVQMGSTTMAVKGTGGTFSFLGFSGPQFAGARFNEINAIEVAYISRLQRIAISGAGRSNETTANPVLAALVSANGPPPSGATAETGLSSESAGDLANKPNNAITQQIAIVTGVQQSGVAALNSMGGFNGTSPFPSTGGAGGGSAPGGSAGGGQIDPPCIGCDNDRPPNSIGGGSIGARFRQR